MGIKRVRSVFLAILSVLFFTSILWFLNTPPKITPSPTHPATYELSESEQKKAARIFSVRMGHDILDSDTLSYEDDIEVETKKPVVDQSGLGFALTVADVKKAVATVYKDNFGYEYDVVVIYLTEYGQKTLTNSYLNFNGIWDYFSYCVDDVCYDKVSVTVMAQNIIDKQNLEEEDFLVDEIMLTGLTGDFKSSDRGIKKITSSEAKELAKKINSYISEMAN